MLFSQSAVSPPQTGLSSALSSLNAFNAYFLGFMEGSVIVSNHQLAGFCAAGISSHLYQVQWFKQTWTYSGGQE